ncbi:MAG TPA: hypothetical protein VGF69_22210 [Thermoanaerobaculia bacterium]
MLEEALASGIVVLPSLVVAELVSGAERPADREAIGDLRLLLRNKASRSRRPTRMLRNVHST